MKTDQLPDFIQIEEHYIRGWEGEFPNGIVPHTEQWVLHFGILDSEDTYYNLIGYPYSGERAFQLAEDLARVLGCGVHYNQELFQ